jgi:GTP cyclohydrolase II
MSARATLPTVHGEFVAVAFQNDKDHKDHLAIVKGDLQGQRAVPVRLHSECLTGDVFGSLRCDCREQLTRALAQLAQAEAGAILYLRQEGRGIGLANKIRAYALQETGMDTVEANQHLGFDDDARDYQIAAAMLQLLGVASVELWTNNPRKLEGLEAEGITVVQRQPLEVRPNPHNLRYLQTKKVKSQHLLRDV